jgi:GT2 family glycosyltransferase
MSVSVVIPAWGVHAERFLTDAIESVAAQVPRPRIVVVDNAADPPLELPDVDVVRVCSRQTVGAARNLGLAQVVTPYVMFWDADDVMLPGTLAALAAILDGDRRMVAAAARILEDDGSDHGWPRQWLAPLARAERAWTSLHAVSSLFPTTGAALMRTDAVRDAGGFPDVDGGDDWVLGVSIAARGRVALSEHPGRIYHRHEASISDAWQRANHAAHGKSVRQRLRSDPAVPAALRLGLPVIAGGQLFVASVVRPLRRRLRPRLRERAIASDRPDDRVSV